MNILEHYIKEVHDIKECENYSDIIEVDVTCDCWGSIQRTKHFTSKKQWQKDLENGYFMA